METKRLFLAITFPEDVRACLEERIDALRRVAARGSFCRTDNLHLTLVFLGETERMDDIVKIMEETGSAPFSLSLSRGGKFAHNRGDIFWVGVQESPSLLSLQARLQNRLQAEGFPIESRPYRPHITLARDVKAANFDNKVTEVAFLVSRYVLMESAHINGRLVYRELYARTLRSD